MLADRLPFGGSDLSQILHRQDRIGDMTFRPCPSTSVGEKEYPRMKLTVRRDKYARLLQFLFHFLK